ncbi:MAG: putative sulfate exporter family transporter [Sphingobacteriaceae bacterium]|nr:putative sulfate exporter family transporter [Sphingobacteriaceae bacterium]
MFQIPKNITGWLILLSIAIVATYLSPFIPGPGSITIALVISLLVGNLMHWQEGSTQVFKYAEKHLLALATILLGFGLNVRLLQELSLIYLLVIVFMVALTLFSSQWYCGKMSISMRWLLGAGSGICGNSAIAASAPALKATVTEIGLAVTVVNLLGTIGIFLFPAIAAALELSTSESALFSGAILQSVGHVVAAGYSISPETGALALLIKMGRILMLGPVILFISYRMNKNTVGAKMDLSIIPNYFWGFIIAAIITSSGIFPATYTKGLEKTGNYLLLLAMSGIGLSMNLKQMVKMGPKAALSGGLIFTTQIIVLLAILYGMRSLG